MSYRPRKDTDKKMTRNHTDIRVAIVGIGNRLKGDDGAGPQFIDLLRSAALHPRNYTNQEHGHKKRDNLILFDCDTVPENYFSPIIKSNPNMIAIVDAVNTGIKPGTIRVLNHREIETTGFSTHTISLGSFVKYLAQQTQAKIFIIGIQIGSNNFSEKLSPPVQEAINLLAKQRLGAKIVLEGVVQGVGFRPFLHRLATQKEFQLAGYVKNFSGGVELFIEGNKFDILLFFDRLTTEAPPLANVKNKILEFQEPRGLQSFTVAKSEKQVGKFVFIPPDISICDECLAELNNPKDRRSHYPFINCTNCGPRFTIIRNTPYDRPKTTMQKFTLCQNCGTEYKDIDNRRYHAEPNACPACGPEVKLVPNPKARNQKILTCLPTRQAREKAIQTTIDLLQQGKIVAVKGIGGFHLCCDATNEEAVAKLRQAKARKYKPFAVMASSIQKIKKFAHVTQQEENLLQSPERPIVLLRKKSNKSIVDSVAPENNYIGAMLPYTPLHYLITSSPQLLDIVATSGNFKDEPLLADNQEALDKLSPIADYFLLHNRDIHARCDDSVVKIINNSPTLYRRARGYVPLPIKLPFKTKPILATGAELKNTFCITRDDSAFVSQHIGDLQNLDTYEFYKEALEHFKRLFRIEEPKIIVHDLHPEYLSTKYASEVSILKSQVSSLPVQHHWAHIASCMADNGLPNEKVIGISLDGTGYGSDGKTWGGEFLICNYEEFDRVGHLKYVPLPGGDQAAKEPWRMAVSYLYDALGSKCKKYIRKWPQSTTILSIIQKNVNAPLTSSMGRLFDAVSSIIGLCDFNTYEGEAAIRLEQTAAGNWLNGKWLNGNAKLYNYTIADGIIDVSAMIQEIAQKDNSPEEVSMRFHHTVADIAHTFSLQLRELYGINKVVLSGGVFQNKVLTELMVTMLETSDFQIYTHSKVPPNDGGISLGQAAIAQFKLCV